MKRWRGGEERRGKGKERRGKERTGEVRGGKEKKGSQRGEATVRQPDSVNWGAPPLSCLEMPPLSEADWMKRGCPVLSYLVLSCLILPCPVLPCLAFSCLALPCLSCLAWPKKIFPKKQSKTIKNNQQNMNIYKKTLVLEALGPPGQPWGYPGSVLGHGVETGSGN